MDNGQIVTLAGLWMCVISTLYLCIHIHLKVNEYTKIGERNLAAQHEILSRYEELREEERGSRANRKRDYDCHMARWGEAMDRYERRQRQHNKITEK